MKTLLLSLFVTFSLAYGADNAPFMWTDGDGLTWTFHPNETLFSKGAERCKSIGFRFPEENELFEAVQYGLFDANENTEFATEIGAFEWVWLKNGSDGPSHLVGNRNKQIMRVLDYERYRVLCVRAANP